ncbi:MAG: PA14 domain-containing protein, partial [Chloroflexota bacterium]|nr:PA14 domain-containing protein [Chloroflexota bacterium]
RHVVAAPSTIVAAQPSAATADPLPAIGGPAATATLDTDSTDSVPLATDGAAPPDAPPLPTPTLEPVPVRVVPQRRLARRLGWAVSAAGILLLLGGIASLTLPRYFQVQANARAVFEEMYTPQAQAGREAAAATATDELYITPGYINLPTLRYLAPAAQPIQWQGMEQLPLPDHGRPVTVILDPPLAADMASFQKFYPHAQIVLFHAPNDAEALVYTIHIPLADISAVRGVRAGLRVAGAPAPTDQTLPGFAFDWGAAGQPGTVRLAATLQVANFAPYTFQWNPAGPPVSDSLRVDGYPISAGQPITLGIGLHTLVATDTVQTATGRAELLWAPAGTPPQALPSANLYDPRRVEPRGLTGFYRSGADTSSAPVSVHVDRVVAYYFHNTVLLRPYNVDWLGKLYIPTAGIYALGTEQISQAQIWLDGTQVVNNSQPNALVETSLNLTAGLHDFRVHYADLDPYSHMYLYWTPPGYPRSIIPAAFLLPQQGSYPTTPESGPWPTLAESQARRPVEGVAAPPPSNLPPAVAVPPPAAPAVVGTPLQPRLLLGSDTPLLHPRGGAVDTAGNYYIFTELDSKIHKFGPDGKTLTSWAVLNKDGKPLTEGSDMFLRDGQLHVLDAGTSDLLAYSLDGQPGDRLHLCECFNPRSITPSADGNYWLADTGNNRLVKISPAGKQITTLGEKGNNPGQFAEPAGVSESSDGTLYVADNGNHRIQSFSAQGSPLAHWDVGESIARDGDRVLAEPGGTVLVSQVAGQALVRYDKSGKELGRWVYTRNGAVLIPGVLAPAKDGVLVLLLRDNVAGVFAP